MSLHTLDLFLSYLNKKYVAEDFFSNSFIAHRDNDKNIIYGKEEVKKRYDEIVAKGLENIRYEMEDSHYLVFYSLDGTDYVLKLKFDDSNKISSIVEEIYENTQSMCVLVIEYDGSRYYGSQRQSSDPSIQEEIERAIKTMINRDVNITLSSRTDRGVHAKHQVLNFYSYGIEPSKYMYALNRSLPKDIRIIDAYSRSQLFNSRYDVVSKEYKYIIDTNDYSVFQKDYVWYQKINNLDLINKELKSICGTHDFRCFCKGEKDDTVRTIYEAYATKNGSLIEFTFKGDGFLHNMIRFIVGSVVNIDKKNEGSLLGLVESQDKNLTPNLAPASGLYLVNIKY